MKRQHADVQQLHKIVAQQHQQIVALEKRVNNLSVHDDALPAKAESPLARALVIARVRVDPAIRLAIDWYLEALNDLSRLEHVALMLPRCERADLITRGHRQEYKCRQVLDDLVVEVREVNVGDPFDPEWHEPVSCVAATSPHAPDRIVMVHTPAFRWRNEFGQYEVIPAEVSVTRAGAKVNGHVDQHGGSLRPHGQNGGAT